MINDSTYAKPITYQQPVTHQPIQNYSRREGSRRPNNFQSQNNQLKQLLNFLLPLLQQLIGNLGNNQHCNNQCDSKSSQELKLTDNEKENLVKAIFPNGRLGVGFPPVVTSVNDDNCDGKLSIGDTVEISTFTGPVNAPGQPSSVENFTVNQDILDRYNMN